MRKHLIRRSTVYVLLSGPDPGGHPAAESCWVRIQSLGKDQSAGDVNRLRLPLDEGVTVIAARGCSNRLIFYEKYYHALLHFAAGYRNLFTDLSALTLPFDHYAAARNSYLPRRQ